MTAIEERSLAFVPESQASLKTRAAATPADLTPLVEQWAPLLFRVAHSVLRSRAEAEDVVQDTFVRVLQHVAELPGIENLRVWLIRIAWNLALDRRRRIRPDQLDPLFTARLTALDLPADAALAQSQRIHAVLAEIDRLPPPERHVLLLAAIEELPNLEIAAILQRSESAVRALLARARARLRQRLEAQSTRPAPTGKEKR